MSISQNHQQITQAWKKLHQDIVRSREEWNDDVSQQFERDYWQTLNQDVPAYLQSLEELDRAIKAALQKIR